VLLSMWFLQLRMSVMHSTYDLTLQNVIANSAEILHNHLFCVISRYIASLKTSEDAFT